MVSLENSKNNEIKVTIHAINDTNERLGRLYNAVETGKLDLSDVALRIKELRHHHEQLHTQKNEIENELSDRRVEPIDMETMTQYATEMQVIISEDHSLIEKFSSMDLLKTFGLPRKRLL